ncbi:hypothetical protein DRN72_01385 [Methanosarcinales archaeon]|nr:MAG: hypothetical protein DRN72_01385 [Methanosarcinales archaeon]
MGGKFVITPQKIELVLDTDEDISMLPYFTRFKTEKDRIGFGLSLAKLVCERHGWGFDVLGNRVVMVIQ